MNKTHNNQHIKHPTPNSIHLNFHPVKPKTIYIKPQILDHDNGSTLVYQSDRNTLHEVSPLLGHEDFHLENNWVKINAVQANVKGRANSIFLSVETNGKLPVK